MGETRATRLKEKVRGILSGVRRFIGWALAAALGLLAVVMLWDSLLGALGLAVLGLAFVPKLDTGLKPRLGIAAAGTLLFALAPGSPSGQESNGSGDGPGREQFVAEAEELLSAARIASDSGEWNRVLALLGPYDTVSGFPRLDSLLRTARSGRAEERRQQEIRRIVERLRTIPAEDVIQNRNLYRRLQELAPDSARFAERYEYYEPLAAEREARIQRQREAEQRAEEEFLASYGPAPERSAWDGSYREVDRYLDAVANDPSSIEIDNCTNPYRVEGEGWVVGCDYRGANAFGGIVRNSNWFVIQNGRVVRMEPADAYQP